MVSLVSDIWSHPNTPLINHLLDTSANMEVLLKNQTISALTLSSGETLEPETLIQLAKIIGALHDIGKATKYFQKYIHETDPIKREKLKTKESNHSMLGAVYSFYAIPRSSIFTNIKDEKVKKQLGFLAASVIMRHHGNLKTLSDLRSFLKDEIKNLKNPKKPIYKQLQSINTEYMNTILQEIQRKTGIVFPFWTEFLEIIPTEQLKKEIRKVQKLFNEFDKNCNKIPLSPNPDVNEIITKNPFCFTVTFLESLLYSLLQEADKTSAMSTDIIERIIENFKQILEQYYTQNFKKAGSEKKDKQLSPLIRARPLIYEEVKQNAENAKITNRLFKMEAPTGSGKTLSNLIWAFTLREKLLKEKRIPYRIVYLLPFLSIIEQVHKVMQDILSTRFDNIPTQLLLKHHHLIDIEYTTTNEEENDFTPNQELFFIEGWNSEIIVSTFHQFFHSLYTNDKGNLRKYHRFMNTIYILDEIQAIPLKYWLLLEKTIPLMLEFTDSYLLMSTATQPAILQNEAIPVSKTGKTVYEKINRIEINYSAEKIDYTQLLTKKENEGILDQIQSTIIITNTIKSAQYLYLEAKNKGFDENYSLFHLSTSVIPKHRLERILEIKKLLEGKNNGNPPFLLTTQVVEAGVDLSFQRGFRDVAPLDSIIQAAGRINRHGYDYKTKKEITNALLEVQPLTYPKTNVELSRSIYDKHLIDLTKETLEQHSPLREKDIPEIITNYFIRAREKAKEKEAREILNAFCKAEYTDFERFQLIEDQKKIPVFIEYDEQAKQIWGKYEQIRGIRDWKEQQAEYLKIKKPLFEYVINLKKKVIEEIQEDLQRYGKIFKLPIDLVPFYYDYQIGFNKEGITNDKFLL